MKIVENRKKIFAASLIVIIIGFAAMIDQRQSNAEKESHLNSNEKYIFCYFEKRDRPLSTWNRSSSLICKKSLPLI